MYVEVDLTADPVDVALRDPDDFGSLKVVVRNVGAGPAALYAALDGVGWLDAHGNAMLRTASLKHLAGSLGSDGDWLRSFDQMVDYAASHGWVALGGSALQVHCEWRQP